MSYAIAYYDHTGNDVPEYPDVECYETDDDNHIIPFSTFEDAYNYLVDKYETVFLDTIARQILDDQLAVGNVAILMSMDPDFPTFEATKEVSIKKFLKEIEDLEKKYHINLNDLKEI